MKKKYIVTNLTNRSYLQNKGKWTHQSLLATLYDTLGEAEDELEKFNNSNKTAVILPVYIHN